MEHVLCTHIRKHLDERGILTPANHGFRSQHSCVSQLLLTAYDLLKRRDLGKQIDVGILDLSKAFDTVPHKRLLGKLLLYGIDGKTHRWIESFLVGRKQCVMVDGARSTEEDVLSGVPQGTVLGPLLFLLYLNDLPSAVDPETKCRLFADDCLLYRSIDSLDDHVQLQRDLDSLQTWANDWGMTFNAKKCYVMSICKSPRKTWYMYQLAGSFLSVVNQEKYLGVLIADSLSWEPHMQQVSISANQKLGFLKRNLKGSPTELKLLAYIAMVRSSLEYASIIWDPHQSNHIDMLEDTQKKAARWICNDHSRYSSVTKMLQQLNLEPLKERRRVARLSYMYSIVNRKVAVPRGEVGVVLNPRATRGNATTDKLVVPTCNTTELQKHFVARTVPEWNRLLDSVTSADSVSSFKSQLQGPTSRP